MMATIEFKWDETYIDTFSAGLATMIFRIDHRLAGRIASRSVWKEDWLEYLIKKEEDIKL